MLIRNLFNLSKVSHLLLKFIYVCTIHSISTSFLIVIIWIMTEKSLDLKHCINIFLTMEITALQTISSAEAAPIPQCLSFHFVTPAIWKMRSQVHIHYLNMINCLVFRFLLCVQLPNCLTKIMIKQVF